MHTSHSEPSAPIDHGNQGDEKSSTAIEQRVGRNPSRVRILRQLRPIVVVVLIFFAVYYIVVRGIIFF